MLRTVVVYVPTALVLALSWFRLEEPRPSGGTVLWIVLLALLPAFGRRLRERIPLAAVAAVLAAHTAFGLSVLHPHHFLGALASRFKTGFLDFYDFPLAFDPSAHPLMHGVLVAAAFGSCLAVGLAIAARRAFAAVLIVVVAAGWPATLLGGGSELQRGALILGAALLVLAGLTAWQTAAAGRALVAGAAVVVCALAASTSPAVAKPEFLDWQHWDFYTRPQKPVSIRFLWNSSYGGIHFPKKVTTVLRIKGPPDSLYWRAATLDVFDGRSWIEPRRQPPVPPNGDPLLPARARERKDVLQERVTVEALRDRHLVGASIPIGFRVPGSFGPVRFHRNGTALADRTLPRGGRYTSFSYAPQPTPGELANSPARYPAALSREGYLDVEPGISTPGFGAANRDAVVRTLFRTYANLDLEPYAQMYAKAEQVVGNPSSPYAAAVALETWFRTGGGFTYTEHPGLPGFAPLADFVTQSKRGYCQHFAGAMALMLRYLGIPARVVAGFSSGTYDGSKGVWTVTDHDAHMWVEAWFAGYGWLPFDPTPGRGALTASYSASSRRFDVSTVSRLLALAAAAVNHDPADYKQDHAFGERGVVPPTTGASADARRGGAAAPASSSSHASLLRLLALIALALLTAIVLAKLVRRRSRFLTSDPRRVAGACRRDLADFLADQRVALPASATLAEVGAAVEQEYPVDARPFVAAATAARFGPADAAPAAARAARRELRALERQIRRQLGILERALGMVSLRSLGFSA